MAIRAACLGIILLIGNVACSSSSGSGTYKIAFVPSRSGQHGIFLMNSDDTGGKLLTEDPNARLRPNSWSPDGKKIAFLTFRAADPESLRRARTPTEYSLYVMDAGGMNQRRMLDCPVRSFGWSPDSSRIFFVSDFENPEANVPDVQSGKKDAAAAIYIVDISKGTPQKVTSLGMNCYAAWSPDGTRLALSSGSVTESNIFVVSIDGKQVRRLTDSSNFNIHPSWSPDGKTIAYVSLPSATADKETGVFLIGADGRSKRHVTDLVSYDVSWSPDGSRLMIQSAAGIYLAGADGGQPVKLDVGSDRPLDAVFTPGGKSIMFRSHDEGEWQLYTVCLEGGMRSRITSHMSALSFCLPPTAAKH